MRDCLAAYMIICALCSVIYLCASYLGGHADPEHKVDPPIDPSTIERINEAIRQPGYKPADQRWAERH